jgi:hypothetical protein
VLAFTVFDNCLGEAMSDMRFRRAAMLVILGALSALACGGGAAATPDNLRESFARQVASVGLVHDFKQAGDDLTFSASYANEPNAQYRVHMDAAVVEPQDKADQPFKGTIKSTWYVNGTAVKPRGTYADLPAEFLDKGLGQECWAFWESKTKGWSWT